MGRKRKINKIVVHRALVRLDRSVSIGREVGQGRTRKQIAPRLLSGERRESFGHGLPPAIKDGLRAIARRERRSMSWVLEQVIIEYFKLPMPEYVRPGKEGK